MANANTVKVDDQDYSASTGYAPGTFLAYGSVFASPLGVAQTGSQLYAVASGTDTYIVTLTPALAVYAAGNCFNILFTNANTGASTINVNGLGAKTIAKNNNVPLVVNDIIAGKIYKLTYDGTDFQIESNDSVIKNVQVSADKYAVASGTDTYVITLAPVPAAYVAGNAYNVVFTNANTGAATINVNTLGAKAITKNGTAPLVVGDIVAGKTYHIVYDGTRFQISDTGPNYQTRTFANDAARVLAVPDFTGQLGVQLDTDAVYKSYGASAGNWKPHASTFLSDTTQSAAVGASTDMTSYTIPAGTLVEDGDFIEFEGFGNVAGSKSGDGINVVVASNTFEAMGPMSTTNGQPGYWVIKGRIVRTGATTGKIYSQGGFTEPIGGADVIGAKWEALTSVTWSGTIVLKFQSGSSWGASSLQQEGMSVRVN